jgi:transposase
MKTRSQKRSTKTHEHDVETRAMIVAYWSKGDSFRAIGKQLGLAHSTVQKIVLKHQEVGSIKNKARDGCPQKLKAEDKEMLKQDVLEDRESRTMTLTGITAKLNAKLITNVSERTVRRALNEQGIKCHAAAVKPFVSISNAAKRVTWCQERLNWKVKDWKKVCIHILVYLYLIFFKISEYLT